jgi:rSAM/selenodomain-associated transferase 1
MGATQVLAVYVKAPLSGRVKTRLAATIGADDACVFYKACAEHVVRAVVGSAWQLQVWTSDPDDVDQVSGWLGQPTYAQIGSSLGDRMAYTVNTSAPCPCVIIGSDTPDIDAQTIAAAFDALTTHDVVLGPAYDGGYYLIGMHRPLPSLFANIDWSTDQVLAQTMHAAMVSGASVHLLQVLRDIDTVDDLHWYAATHKPSPFPLPHIHG